MEKWIEVEVEVDGVGICNLELREVELLDEVSESRSGSSPRDRAGGVGVARKSSIICLANKEKIYSKVWKKRNESKSKTVHILPYTFYLIAKLLIIRLHCSYSYVSHLECTSVND